MGKKRRINDKKLLDMVVNQCLSTVDIAKRFGVSRQAIHKRMKYLRDKTTAVIISPKAVEAVDKQLKVMDQLITINKEAHRLLNKMDDNNPLKVKILSEIRAQLNFQMQCFEILFNARAAQDFQESVLEALGEIDPYARQQVIQKLNEKSALRESLRFN